MASADGTGTITSPSEYFRVSGQNRAPRLLVVDDEPQICTYVERVATRLGFTVRSLVEPEHFQHALETFRPNLLILDLKMPNADGIELLRQTGSLSFPTRVIVMSGMDQRVLRAAENVGRSTGVDVFGVLQKPIRLRDLEDAIAQAIGHGALLKPEEIRQAIADKQLVMHFQPKVSRQEGRWVVRGAEALVRWEHPRYGLLLPGDFLGLTESGGLMDELTDYVLAECVRQAAQWSQNEHALNLAVNIPASTFRHEEFPDRFKGLLSTHAVSGSKITLEITESAAMEDAQRAKNACLRLRMTGAGLSIDDFGTGFSSLQQLYDLPFSELKVDRRFLVDVPQNQEAKAIIRATVSLAHALGMTACAEGVETREALAYIESVDCDSAQGFLIGRAMPAEALIPFARNWNERATQASGSGVPASGSA
jgi:EAL domain-containing protein (putative c-di-GMP-specific phosphodiesterase class I)